MSWKMSRACARTSLNEVLGVEAQQSPVCNQSCTMHCPSMKCWALKPSNDGLDRLGGMKMALNEVLGVEAQQSLVKQFIHLVDIPSMKCWALKPSNTAAIYR